MKLEPKQVEGLTKALDVFAKNTDIKDIIKSLSEKTSEVLRQDSIEIFLEPKNNYLVLSPLNIVNTFLDYWLHDYRLRIISQDNGEMELEIVKFNS